jgi:predicted Zn-dependent protease
MSKRTRRYRSIFERLETNRRERAKTDEQLLALAAEPVPLGSGFVSYGTGRHAYVKQSTIDGSARVLRFHSHDTLLRAMSIGIAADLAAEYDPDAAA